MPGYLTPIIDEFLIYYAAERERLEPKMDRQLKKYKQVARQISAEYLNIFKSEYIATRLFKEGWTNWQVSEPLGS